MVQLLVQSKHNRLADITLTEIPEGFEVKVPATKFNMGPIIDALVNRFPNYKINCETSCTPSGEEIMAFYVNRGYTVRQPVTLSIPANLRLQVITALSHRIRELETLGRAGEDSTSDSERKQADNYLLTAKRLADLRTKLWE